MCCNKPINYKMLAKFFLDIIAWLFGEGGNSYILGYRMCHFRVLSFGWKINFWVYFVVCNQILWSDSHGTLDSILFQSVERPIGLEWGLEQISDLSLLTNQVIKVIYSYFNSPP